jgi:hypothetical protein
MIGGRPPCLWGKKERGPFLLSSPVYVHDAGDSRGRLAVLFVLKYVLSTRYLRWKREGLDEETKLQHADIERDNSGPGAEQGCRRYVREASCCHDGPGRDPWRRLFTAYLLGY